MFNSYYTEKATLWYVTKINPDHTREFSDPTHITCRVQYGNTLKQNTDGSIYISAFTLWSGDNLFDASGWSSSGGGYLSGGSMPYVSLGWQTGGPSGSERALTLEGITDFSGFVRIWRLSA